MDSLHRMLTPKLENEDFVRLGNFVPIQKNTNQMWHTPQIEPQGTSLEPWHTPQSDPPGASNISQKLTFRPPVTKYSQMKIKRSMISKTDNGLDSFLKINKDAVQNPQAWEKVIMSRQSTLSAVKREPGLTSVAQDSYLPISVPYIKPEIAIAAIAQDLFMLQRNNNRDLGSATVKPEFGANGAISQQGVSEQGSPKRIKLEVRPKSPTLFNSIGNIKDERN